MSALPIVVATPEWALLGSSRLVVSVWRTKVTLAAIAETERAIEAVTRASYDQKYASVSVIEKNVSMSFDDRARDASAALMRRWGTRCIAHGYLVEGTGFLPAAVRTATAGLSLITRSPYPTKVFDDAMTLAEWFTPLTHHARSELTRAIATARGAGLDGAAANRGR